jgi:hypothetical protein
MKRHKLLTKEINAERINAVLKTEYQKEDVWIAIGGISSALGFCFEMVIGGEPFKAIITNGKLRRKERRKIVRVLMLALQLNHLQPITFLKPENVRGAFVFGKPEVKR